MKLDQTSQAKIIAVVGQTASGKSALALEIARLHDGEIICADSRTIYKGMDVGTAKPTQQEQLEIPHYGLDLVDPGEAYSAAQFKDYAVTVIKDIWSRGKLPIIAGGSGLYVNGILYDYTFGDKIDSELRSYLSNKSVEELATLAQQKNITITPDIAKNKRHLQRLIERDGLTQNNQELAYDALMLGVELSKSQLAKRIERRVEIMFRAGLRKEYNDLRQKYPENSEAFTGIGYREFAEFEAGDASMSEVKRLIVKDTMSLAKRQATWFKRDKHIHWVSSQDEALALVADFLQN